MYNTWDWGEEGGKGGVLYFNTSIHTFISLNMQCLDIFSVQ